MKPSLLNWLLMKVIQSAERRGRYDPIPGYMDRWYFFGSRKDEWRPRARLHHILRSDAGRDLHDHPWWYVTIILRGGYWEWIELKRHDLIPHRALVEMRPGNLPWLVAHWRGPGIYFRSRKHRHRLELPTHETAWTLFITGPKKQDWGFYTTTGFVPWQQYEREA